MGSGTSAISELSRGSAISAIGGKESAMSVEELRYRKLEIWKRGIQLVKTVYGLLNSFPKHEQYALSDQLKRAVVSVPSNIAEGSKRNTVKEFRNVLCIASGSLAEVTPSL
jgi:hypothetical protein